MPLVATLITNPSTPLLNISLIKKASKVVNGSNINWLAENIACDIILPIEANIDICQKALKLFIGNEKIDIVIQEIEKRRKHLLIADMDSTMIQQECLDELAKEIGLSDEILDITRRAMNGEIEFNTALRQRMHYLKGISTKIINTVIKNRITFTPGGRELISTMKKNGAYTVLVSGGFTVFTKIIAHALGFDEHYGNSLIEKDNLFTGEIVEPILDSKEKSKILLKTADMLNISPQEILAVGDGANDVEMIKLAGSGVALHAKPILAEQAKIRIDYSDLTALLYIQGYKKDEFIM
ncbi:Phosphoserine phosphatase [Liberibacter crescens BT-1]|uniref:Phosphoserine phosphatase n=1 Tax=Liberibacter crescens (strain BT-1) TaxID=1215343 RepID=L0EUW6_LIBCB|nr:phosphoserine phosphatase SerB [Liberibacter crescens]AGA64630.1 Phosphoserine phosphatase [Liberibacter crescens BT-1]AMC12744.1 phosphoserine phosphatase [Liberibacter crescens]